MGGVVVESLGVTPVIHGRQRLRMRFALQTIPASAAAPFYAAGSRAYSGLACPACPELVAGNLATY